MNEPVSSTTTNFNSIEVAYTLGDLYALNLQMWRYWAILIAVLVAFIVCIQVLFSVLDGLNIFQAFMSIDWQFPSILVVVLAAWILTTTFVGYWWSRWRRKFVLTRFTVADDGISVKNSKAESLLFWSALKKVRSTRKRLFLFISSNHALILPRRCFSDEAEFDRWVEVSKRRWAEFQAQR